MSLLRLLCLCIVFPSRTFGENVNCVTTSNECRCESSETANAGSSCTIDCTSATCNSLSLLCRDGDDCVVDCTVQDSCSNATIICPQNRNCTVECDANACSNVTIDASLSTSLSLSCTEFESCLGSTVIAPADELSVYCAEKRSCFEAEIHAHGSVNVSLQCHDFNTTDAENTAVDGSCGHLAMYLRDLSSAQIDCSAPYSCADSAFAVNGSNVFDLKCSSSFSCLRSVISLQGRVTEFRMQCQSESTADQSFCDSSVIDHIAGTIDTFGLLCDGYYACRAMNIQLSGESVTRVSTECMDTKQSITSFTYAPCRSSNFHLDERVGHFLMLCVTAGCRNGITPTQNCAVDVFEWRQQNTSRTIGNVRSAGSSVPLSYGTFGVMSFYCDAQCPDGANFVGFYSEPLANGTTLPLTIGTMNFFCDGAASCDVYQQWYSPYIIGEYNQHCWGAYSCDNYRGGIFMYTAKNRYYWEVSPPVRDRPHIGHWNLYCHDPFSCANYLWDIYDLFSYNATDYIVAETDIYCEAEHSCVDMSIGDVCSMYSDNSQCRLHCANYNHSCLNIQFWQWAAPSDDAPSYRSLDVDCPSPQLYPNNSACMGIESWCRQESSVFYVYDSMYDDYVCDNFNQTSHCCDWDGRLPTFNPTIEPTFDPTLEPTLVTVPAMTQTNATSGSWLPVYVVICLQYELNRTQTDIILNVINETVVGLWRATNVTRSDACQFALTDDAARSVEVLQCRNQGTEITAEVLQCKNEDALLVAYAYNWELQGQLLQNIEQHTKLTVTAEDIELYFDILPQWYITTAPPVEMLPTSSPSVDASDPVSGLDGLTLGLGVACAVLLVLFVVTLCACVYKDLQIRALRQTVFVLNAAKQPPNDREPGAIDDGRRDTDIASGGSPRTSVLSDVSQPGRKSKDNYRLPSLPAELKMDLAADSPESLASAHRKAESVVSNASMYTKQTVEGGVKTVLTDAVRQQDGVTTSGDTAGIDPELGVYELDHMVDI